MFVESSKSASVRHSLHNEYRFTADVLLSFKLDNRDTGLLIGAKCST